MYTVPRSKVNHRHDRRSARRSIRPPKTSHRIVSPSPSPSHLKTRRTLSQPPCHYLHTFPTHAPHANTIHPLHPLHPTSHSSSTPLFSPPHRQFLPPGFFIPSPKPRACKPGINRTQTPTSQSAHSQCQIPWMALMQDELFNCLLVECRMASARMGICFVCFAAVFRLRNVLCSLILRCTYLSWSFCAAFACFACPRIAT
jgi:hypothetical protein